MQLILTVGVQGAGKSTFCADRFLHTHVRLSRDLLGTDHRQRVLFHAALSVGARVVIDNTNPTPQVRARFVAPALACGYEVHGYFFAIERDLAIARNAERPADRRVPDVAILGTFAKLVPPGYGEGFAKIYRVHSRAPGAYDIELVPTGANEESQAKGETDG